MFRIIAAAACLAASAASAATTTVSDVATSRGPTIRIAHYRADVPVANLYVMSGGDGALRLQPNGAGTTDNFVYSPLIRNRETLLAAGISIIMVDAPSDMLGSTGMPFPHRTTAAHAAELLDVHRFVQARDNVPAWWIGFSAGGPSVANLALQAPAATPMGLMMLSPNTTVDPHTLSLNLEGLRRPTLLLSHASDSCAGTPPANATVVASRITGATKRHAVFTGGSFGSRGGGCDSTGYHGLGGSDAQFVSELTSWMRSNAAAAAPANYQSLWWRSPAQSENGWGVNITHQGDVLFATWYTYDLDGSPLWLFSDSRKTVEGTYTGQLYQARGSPFNVAYDASRFLATPVGTVTFAFTDSNAGTFTYTVNGTTQSKTITRFVFSNPAPTCVAGGAPDATNYQDLWWRSPGGSESGWGVNIAHQGDILFATWYTYGADGTDFWMVMSAGAKIAEGTYRGEIHRTTGAPFNAYDPSRFGATLAGTGTFTFTDANNGTFSYTIDGVTQSKPITRYVFASPLTACRF